MKREEGTRGGLPTINNQTATTTPSLAVMANRASSKLIQGKPIKSRNSIPGLLQSTKSPYFNP